MRFSLRHILMWANNNLMLRYSGLLLEMSWYSRLQRQVHSHICLKYNTLYIQEELTTKKQQH